MLGMNNDKLRCQFAAEQGEGCKVQIWQILVFSFYYVFKQQLPIFAYIYNTTMLHCQKPIQQHNALFSYYNQLVLYFMDSFTLSHSKRPSTSNLQVEKQSTLWSKMAECWLRQNNSQYQQLLIDTKELQLTLLKEESLNKSIMKSFDQKKKDIQQLQNELKTITNETLSNKIYLHQYYQYLNDKLKSGTVSINLNMKLDNLTKSLKEKLENQRASLNEIVIKRKLQLSQLEQQLVGLQNRKQHLSQNLRNIRQEKQIRKREGESKKEMERARKIAEKQEYDQLRREVESLENEKDHLQKNQAVLKTLLNIQEVHRKYWNSIEVAIKAEFTAKVYEAYTKESEQLQYKLKLSELEAEVTASKKQLTNLKDNVNEQQRKKNHVDKLLQEAQKKSEQLNRQLSVKFQKKATI